uniref:Thiol:disulfide interchange protein n=1 Tax=Callithamnion tetricum TaxID=193179 RepID=A0A4D6WQY0_9FLOR|nr:Thiol:disulfide interchange protein [Callithamnion tetricum]
MLSISLIYTQYEIFSYYMQQEICNIVNLNTHSHRIISYLFIFISGLITSLNPCFLSILPISLSYLNMKKIDEANKVSFILGIFTSFIFLLIITHLISYRYHSNLSGIPLISSIIVIILGLSFLQIVDLSIYNLFIVNQFKLSIAYSNFSQDYLVGLFCSLTTLPCSTPIILTVLFWLSHADSFFLSMIYLITYLIGSFISIFTLITFTFNSISKFFIFRFWNILFPLSGFIILFNGTLSLLEKIYS